MTEVRRRKMGFHFSVILRASTGILRYLSLDKLKEWKMLSLAQNDYNLLRIKSSEAELTARMRKSK